MSANGKADFQISSLKGGKVPEISPVDRTHALNRKSVLDYMRSNYYDGLRFSIPQ
ncbi:MAG: hypothetical protein V3R25_09615 [Nitrosomonadaceae bacterium]